MLPKADDDEERSFGCTEFKLNDANDILRRITDNCLTDIVSFADSNEANTDIATNKASAVVNGIGDLTNPDLEAEFQAKGCALHKVSFVDPKAKLSLP